MYNGTVGWGGIYGPSGGHAVSQTASVDMGGSKVDQLPLALPVILLLGVMAWWALEKWD